MTPVDCILFLTKNSLLPIKEVDRDTILPPPPLTFINLFRVSNDKIPLSAIVDKSKHAYYLVRNITTQASGYYYLLKEKTLSTLKERR